MVFKTYDNFEDGDTSDWSENNGTITAVSSPTFGGSFAAELSENDSNTDEVNTATKAYSNGRFEEFRFYYYETSNNSSGGIGFRNQNGNSIIRAGTDNPEYIYVDANGEQTAGSGPDETYNVWVELKFVFDWASSTVDISWTPQSGGGAVTETNVPLINGATGIQRVRLGRVHQKGSSVIEYYVDNLEYDLGPQPPADPENSTIDYVGVSEFDVSWDEGPVNADFGDPDNYRVQRSVNGGSYTTIATPTSTSYTDTNISEDTDYQYRVRAENNEGVSGYDNTTTETSGGAPKSLSVSTAGVASIDLSWINPAGDLSEIDIYRAQSESSLLSDYSLISTVVGTETTDSGLVNGRTYHYRLVAVYPRADSTPSEDRAATTVLPATDFDSVEEQ